MNRHTEEDMKVCLSSVLDKYCKVFNDELDQVTRWLKEAVEFTECWQAPSHSIPSIRVQLERHLAFSLEVQTHQNQTERVVFQGQDIIEQSPSVSSSLSPRLETMVADWNLLERSLDIQAKQIKEALAVVEATINTGLKGSCNELLVEETRDAIDFMRIKLRRNQGRSSPVNVSFSHSNTSNSDTTKQSAPQSSRFSPSCTSNNSSLSSTPEFEVLYNELSDWLNDMHLAVSDSADMRVSEHHKQHMCKGYEQELQLREVSRSKLQRKGIQLMASKPRLTDDVSIKLESLNQQWHALQQHIAPSPLLARKANSSRSSATCTFGSAEQAMSMALEVEDVIGQLKAWLTQIEGRLFETDSDTTDLNQLETRLRSIQGLKDEIDHNSQSIDVVLKLCSLLQDDDWYLSTHKRERESLQLGAINVERRWQNVKTHSEEMLVHVKEAVETTKVSLDWN
ncbi:A-kinase anchor protein 6 isoform X2 [Strongylocentrotus purpuratus]|uniref:Dystrophin n=1 Tax=Strongylocentrotus purpuratus TaxID=7668 RepID=A0A7M7PSG0_STRPU|nr:A-kinase anchor protein 6 isoform X2 [Strongylocentrotus purpuratus]